MTTLGHGFKDGIDTDDGARRAAYLSTATGVAAIAAGKQARDGLLRLVPGDHVLDVGCGLGDDARRLATLVGPDGHAVGVDASRALLDRARAEASPVEWVVADAQALPFDADRFAAARTERTLQHVADPAAVVREMARVTRSGGVVLACEPDWSTSAVSTLGPEVADALRDGMESAIRHSRVGADLVALLLDAGVGEVQVSVEAIPTRDFALFHAMTDVASTGTIAVQDGTLTQDALDAAIARGQDAARTGRFVAYVTLVTAWGTV